MNAFCVSWAAQRYFSLCLPESNWECTGGLGIWVVAGRIGGGRAAQRVIDSVYSIPWPRLCVIILVVHPPLQHIILHVRHLADVSFIRLKWNYTFECQRVPSLARSYAGWVGYARYALRVYLFFKASKWRNKTCTTNNKHHCKPSNS